jgi:molybdopterin-binding protein
MPEAKPRDAQPPLRIGQAAEVLGVSVDTIRRWAEDGTLKTNRSGGGQRLVSAAEVRRMLDARRKAAPQRPISAQSARNRFPGVVTRVEVDRVAAIVEVQAGPHRLVSLVTAESVHELKLAPGVQVIAVVKATNVMIDLPS